MFDERRAESAVDGRVVEILRKLENLIYANFDAINTLILGNNPGWV
jgi:hypothetical protein